MGLGGGESAPKERGKSGESAKDHRLGWSHRVLERTGDPGDFREDPGGLGKSVR